MRIAVNTRFLLNDRLEGFGYFIYEHFIRITKAYPEHEFIFIFDRPYDKKFVFNENVKAVITGPPARHPLLWKLWYDVKIPYVLKKYKADVFVSADGFCSLATKVPQCLVVHDLSFLHYPAFIPKSQLMFLRYYTPRYIKQAKAVITVSQFSWMNGARVIKKALQEEDPDKRLGFANAIAYYMKLAYNNWHKEVVHDDAIQSELSSITDGQLTFTNTPYVKAYRQQDSRDRDRGGYGKQRGKFQSRGGNGGRRNDRNDNRGGGANYKKKRY